MWLHCSLKTDNLILVALRTFASRQDVEPRILNQGSHRSGKTTFLKKSGNGQENLILVRKIQNLAKGQEKVRKKWNKIRKILDCISVYGNLLSCMNSFVCAIKCMLNS